MTRHLGSFESERTDILKRRSYLLEKVVTDPRGLVDAMPPVFGEHYQGEWAIYSTSMLSAALVNTAILYPETREEAVEKIDSLIRITHKAKFENADAMRDFAKIGEDNGYLSEALNETEATISRKIFTEDGSILSDIYNVANQVACLKGVYEGYNIEL